MSLVTLFTRRDPTIGYGDLTVQFDAVLEQVVTKAVHVTEFPVEFGANAADHRVVLPTRYTLVGAISNNPIRIGWDSDPNMLIGGTISQQVMGRIGGRAGAVISAVGGAVSAAFLAGSSGTRSSNAWALLSELMITGEPFEVQAGDENIPDMVITRLDQRRLPETENGLEFIAELRQLPIVHTQTVASSPVQSVNQLRAGDPIRSLAAPVESRGQVVGMPE